MTKKFDFVLIFEGVRSRFCQFYENVSLQDLIDLKVITDSKADRIFKSYNLHEREYDFNGRIVFNEIYI